MRRSLVDVFSVPVNVKKADSYTRKHYRPHDPGRYLYNKIIDFHNNQPFDGKFSDHFFELLYVTLKAWNMNQRGAKLQKFENFKKSIIKHRSKIEALKSYKIEKLNKRELYDVKELIEKLFNDLDLVADGKPKLVTFSKTLHFFLPELCIPIDRRYTLKFFNKQVPKHKDSIFELYFLLFTNFHQFATQEVDLLSRLKDEYWNRYIPKIIDNLIIGYISENINTGIKYTPGNKIKTIIEFHKQGYSNKEIIEKGYNKSNSGGSSVKI